MENFISNVMPKAAGTTKASGRKNDTDTSFQQLLKAEAGSDDKRIDNFKPSRERPDSAKNEQPAKEEDFVKKDFSEKAENLTKEDKTSDTGTEAGLAELLAAIGNQTNAPWNNMLTDWLNASQQITNGESGEPVFINPGYVQAAGEIISDFANTAAVNAAKEQTAFMQALAAETGTDGLAGADAGMAGTEARTAAADALAAETIAKLAENEASTAKSAGENLKQPVLTGQSEASADQSEISAGQVFDRLNKQSETASDAGISKKENQAFIKNPIPMGAEQTAQTSEERQQVLQALEASLSQEGIVQASGKEESFTAMKTETGLAGEQPKTETSEGRFDSQNPLAELTTVRQASSGVKAPEGGHVHMEIGQTEDLSKKLLEQIMKKVSLGQKELEVALEPANLGKIIVRISYGDHNTTVSLMCSESKTLNLLAQNSKEMGAILEANLGEPATIYVDKQQESNYLNQERDNERRQEQYQQEEQKQAEKQDSDDNPIDFMQKLRLQMVNGLQMSYN